MVQLLNNRTSGCQQALNRVFLLVNIDKSFSLVNIDKSFLFVNIDKSEEIGNKANLHTANLCKVSNFYEPMVNDIDH